MLVHHRARAWKDADGLRDSLKKAEKRLHKAQVDAQTWRRRAETAEARLARYERMFRPALVVKRKLRG